jgi:hypothetical protein
MQFMLMIIADETKPLPSPAELKKLGEEYRDFTHDIVKSGQLRSAIRLRPSSRATTVRGKKIADGPFSHAKEQPAGFFLVDCEHLDEAISIASRIPGVRLGEAIEIRPVVPLPAS